MQNFKYIEQRIVSIIQSRNDIQKQEGLNWLSSNFESIKDSTFTICTKPLTVNLSSKNDMVLKLTTDIIGQILEHGKPNYLEPKKCIKLLIANVLPKKEIRKIAKRCLISFTEKLDSEEI